REQQGIATRKDLRAIYDLVGFKGDNSLRLAAFRRNSQNTLRLITKKYSVFQIPGGAEDGSGIADRDRRPTGNRDFLELPFRRCIKRQPAAVWREERRIRVLCRPWNGFGFHVRQILQVQLSIGSVRDGGAIR